MHEYGDPDWILQTQNLEQTETNNILTEVYSVPIDRIGFHLPLLGQSHAAPYTAFVLKRSLQSRNQNGEQVLVTLEYETPTLSFAQIPPAQFAENSAINEVNIEEHSKFNSSAWQEMYDAVNGRFKLDSELCGVESYLRATKSVSVRTFSQAKPSDPSSLVGKKGSPGAGYGATDLWLCVGANRSQEGPLWVVTKEFLYNADGWNDEVYD